MNQRTGTRGRKLVALGVAASFVLAACGDDGGDSAATTAGSTATTAGTATTAAAATTAAPATTAAAATTTAAAKPSKSPVLIAATMDTAGPSPSGKEMPAVLKATAEYINSKGGLNGHPITVEVSETKGDAATAQAATDALLAKKPVLFFLVTASTETSQGASLAKAEVPVMGVGYNPAVWGANIGAFKLACSNAADTKLPCGLPNAFAVTTTTGAVVDEQLYGAKAVGAKKVASAACAEVDSCSGAAPIFDATAKALGLETIGSVKVSSTKADLSAECINFIQQGVDFIQISGGESLGVNLFNSCTDQGYKGAFGASAGSVRGATTKLKGITLAGGLNAFPWWVDDAPVKEYRDVMSKAGITEEGWSDPTATGIYSALMVFAKAQAALSDAPTGAEALKNMYTIKNETLGGLVSPITWTADNPDRSRHCFWPYILKDGKFAAPLGGLKYQCSPAEG